MAPEPQELQLAHAARIGSLLNPLAEALGERCLSEYSFANLWLFRREHRYRFSVGPWPVISGLTYDGLHHAMPLFVLDQAPRDVIDWLLATHNCLYPVPAAQVVCLDLDRHPSSTNHYDADYLYPADNFRHYRGALLSKKRNLMRQLVREHTVLPVAYAEPWRLQALHVLAGWMLEKGKPVGGADELACTDALRKFSR